jgi:small subunit ribosomal protein S6
LIFILDPALGDDGVEAAAQAAKEVLAREGAEVLDVQKWGKKRLAYEIKKRREGHYVYLRVQAVPKAVVEIERHLKMSESVLNSLVHRVQEPRKAASPAAAPAGEPVPQEA